jgi:perosamine synthetase
MIPYFRVKPSMEELDALIKVQSSGHWVIGDEIEESRIRLLRMLKAKHLVLTSNGFSALFLSIKSLGITNQKIVVPCLSTCFAITNAIKATGNIPIFCDLNLEDGNCCLDSVTKIVKKNNAKFIISPNHAGLLSDIAYFKKDLGLVVIEDSCQSFFSSLNQELLADTRILSFYPTKEINGIDGGALITNNLQIYQSAKTLGSYCEQNAYEALERYNFRFLNINAAILLVNLDKMDVVKNKLIKITKSYDSLIRNSSKVSRLFNKREHVLQRYVLQIKDDLLKKRLLSSCAQKIEISKFYCWICKKEEAHQFPNAMLLSNNCYCIPYYGDLKKEEIILISEVIKHALS